MFQVYEIRTRDGKVYVGCTSKLDQRMAVHRYQKSPFVLVVHSLEIVYRTRSREKAHDREAKLIAKYDSTNPKRGYNRRLGGSQYGFPSYVKLSRNVKGKKNPMWGRKHSKETKLKIGKAVTKRT